MYVIYKMYYSGIANININQFSVRKYDLQFFFIKNSIYNTI